MSAWDFVAAAVLGIAAGLLGALVVGFLAGLVLAVIHAVEERRADRVIEDVMGVPPRGARFAYQCTLCRRDAIETVHDADEFIAMVHNPRPVCDECTDTLARLDQEAQA